MNPATWKFNLLKRMRADRELTGADYRVASGLLEYRDKDPPHDCYPLETTIADNLGMTVRAVQKRLRHLVDIKWLTIEKRDHPKRVGKLKGGKRNFYDFHEPTRRTDVHVVEEPTRRTNETRLGEQTGRDYANNCSAHIDDPFVQNPLDDPVGERAPSARPKRGQRLEDFKPSIADARAMGFTAKQAEYLAEVFHDHQLSILGPRSFRADWNERFRSWLSKALERGHV